MRNAEESEAEGEERREEGPQRSGAEIPSGSVQKALVQDGA